MKWLNNLLYDLGLKKPRRNLSISGQPNFTSPSQVVRIEYTTANGTKFVDEHSRPQEQQMKNWHAFVLGVVCGCVLIAILGAVTLPVEDTNDQIIVETLKCQNAGLKAHAMYNVSEDVIGVRCIPVDKDGHPQ